MNTRFNVCTGCPCSSSFSSSAFSLGILITRKAVDSSTPNAANQKVKHINSSSGEASMMGDRNLTFVDCLFVVKISKKTKSPVAPKVLSNSWAGRWVWNARCHITARSLSDTVMFSHPHKSFSKLQSSARTAALNGFTAWRRRKKIDAKKKIKIFTIYRCNCLYKRRYHRFLHYHLLYSDPMCLRTRYWNSYFHWC